MSGLRQNTNAQKGNVLKEMRQVTLKPVSQEAISGLDESNKPNMIYSSSGGSFVRSRQNRLLKANSYPYPPNNDQQERNQTFSISRRPASVTEDILSNETSSLSRTSSKSSVNSPSTPKSQIKRRQSQSDISIGKNSNSTNSSISRSNSRNSLKSYTLPTASSSARQVNAKTTKLHSKTSSEQDVSGTTTPFASRSLSRSSSRSSIKSNTSLNTKNTELDEQKISNVAKLYSKTSSEQDVSGTTTPIVALMSLSRSSSRRSSIKSNTSLNTKNTELDEHKISKVRTGSSREKRTDTSPILSKEIPFVSPHNLSRSSSRSSVKSILKTSSISSRSSRNFENESIVSTTPIADIPALSVYNSTPDTTTQQPLLQTIQSYDDNNNNYSHLLSISPGKYSHVEEDKGRASSSSNNRNLLPTNSNLANSSEHDVNRMTSTTSSSALDYFNTTLAGYATPGSSVSQMMSQSHESHTDMNSAIAFSPSGESVFNYPNRPSSGSESTLTGNSDLESELSDEDERSYDVNLSRRGSSLAGEYPLPLGQETMSSAILSKPKRRGKKGNKEKHTLKVTKYRGDVKTVRQHIKPGTVDDLANLFSESRIQGTDLPLQRVKKESVGHSSIEQDTFPQTFQIDSLSNTNTADASSFDYLAASKAMIEQAKLSKGSRERLDRDLNETNVDVRETTESSEFNYNLNQHNNDINESPMSKYMSSSQEFYNGDKEVEKGDNAELSHAICVSSHVVSSNEENVDDSEHVSLNEFSESIKDHQGHIQDWNETSPHSKESYEKNNNSLSHSIPSAGVESSFQAIFRSIQAENTDVHSRSDTTSIDTQNIHIGDHSSVYEFDTNGEVVLDLEGVDLNDPSRKIPFDQETSVLAGTTNARYQLYDSESNLNPGTLNEEVITSGRWDTRNITTSSGGPKGRNQQREWRTDEIDQKAGRWDKDQFPISMSKNSTGSTTSRGNTSLTNLAHWTTHGDITVPDVMIDHRRDSVHTGSSTMNDPAITTIEETRGTSFVGDKNGNDKKNENDEAHLMQTTTVFTESGNTSYKNGYTSHNDTIHDEEDGHHPNARVDGELFITKTEVERQVEETGCVITQHSTDLPSQTTGGNLFAHSTFITEEERGEEGVSDDAGLDVTCNEAKGESEKNGDDVANDEQNASHAKGAAREAVDRNENLGQISMSSSTHAQVEERNETLYSDVTDSTPTPVNVPLADGFNAILSGLDLGNIHSDSNLASDVNIYSTGGEYTISNEDTTFSLENSLHENESMRRKKKQEKTFVTERDSGELVVSVENDAIGHQILERVNKTISDDDDVNVGVSQRSHDSIDDEIRELHLQLSPRTSNNIVAETTYKLAQNVNSNQGSLSSRSGTVKGPTAIRETVFNSDFFSENQITEEKNSIVGEEEKHNLESRGHTSSRSSLSSSSSSSSTPSSSRKASPEILTPRQPGRSDGHETNNQVTSIQPPVFDTHSSGGSQQAFAPRILTPHDDSQIDTPFPYVATLAVETGYQIANTKDSDSNKSHSSNSSSGEEDDDVNKHTNYILGEGNNHSINDESFSHVNDVTSKSEPFRTDYSVQINESVKSRERTEEEISQKYKTPSLSSKSSSLHESARESGNTSSSSSSSTLSPSYQSSENRKSKHRNSESAELWTNNESPRRNRGINKTALIHQDHVRSLSGDSDQAVTYAGTTRITISNDNDNIHTHQITDDEANDMAAIVGEVSSFNIHRKVSVEESNMTPSNRSSTSQVQPVPLERGEHSDIYLIQDKGGDMFALQEVEGVTNNANPQTVTKIRPVNRDDNNRQMTSYSQGGSFNGSNYPNDRNRTDIYVDSAAVNDEKAREVITAYLNSNNSNTNVNQSLDSNLSRGSSTYGYSQGMVNTDNSRRSDVLGGNIAGPIVLNNAVKSPTSSNPHSIIVHQGVGNNDFMNNSTVTVNQEVNTKTDSSQNWDIHGYEPYTTGSGGEQNYKSSFVVTNMNTPEQQSQFTYSNQPRVDSSFDSQRSNSVINTPQGISVFQPLNINVNQDQGIAPFVTRPITIQTTTNAVVGEKVDMKIDFPKGGHRNAADNGSSSSDEANKSRYVIRSVPKKSSLKKGSVYNSSSNSFDSNADISYTKKETNSANIVIGGRKSIGSVSPSSVNSSFYVNRQGSDRGRENRNRHIAGNQKTRRIGKSGSKHHSPERIFKNPKLSLRKSKSVSSDEETDGRRYRTVTKVVVDGDDESKSRSASSSPSNRYRVSSQHSFRGNQDDSQSLNDKSYQIVSVKSKKGQIDSGSGSYSENESDYEMSRRQYKVVSRSDEVINSHDVIAHSSPNPEMYQEAVIHRTEREKASKSQTLPSSRKSHKTVIQLELGDKKQIKEKSRVESDAGSQKSKLARAKSVDNIDGRSNFSLSNGLNTSKSRNQHWRTDRARSLGSSSDDGSSSDSGSAGPFNVSSSKLVKTSKQKKGHKTFVVNSTVDDHEHKHPSGWYLSTIDINDDMPKRSTTSVSLNKSKNQSFNHSHSFTEEQRNSNKTEEKSVYYVRQKSNPSSNHVTKFRVHPSPDSGQGTEVASSDGENEIQRQKVERVERIYEVRTDPIMPEQFTEEETEITKDMRVLRGKILIKNRLDSDHDEDDFDQNVNVFDHSFHMEKDNPLYSSDTDLQASLRREEQEELSRQINQDITFEQVSKIASSHKSKQTSAELTPKPRRKQNLSTLLLSKLANVDKQDIRQTIDVQHHNEEIFGNIDFIHADGAHTGSQNTSNFDSVSERVELTLQQGKAFVTIKVIAERIVPTDYEFNVWRKSQAIVTRQIEVDLLANQQRRRFYNHVMDTKGMPASVVYTEGDGRLQESLASHEKQLSSLETLKLFSQILDVADGQGDEDHTSMRTKQEMGQLSGTGADLLY